MFENTRENRESRKLPERNIRVRFVPIVRDFKTFLQEFKFLIYFKNRGQSGQTGQFRREIDSILSLLFNYSFKKLNSLRESLKIPEKTENRENFQRETSVSALSRLSAISKLFSKNSNF
jgi:hypothetical protein